MIQSGKYNFFYGRHHTKEAKDKISRSKIGKHVYEGYYKGKFGKEHNITGRHWKWSEESRLKISKENHPNWQGGKSFELYGVEFNEDLKEVIRNRDKRRCRICERTESDDRRKLQVHHIDYNKLNNDIENLITLCVKCHSRTNYNRIRWIKYFFNFNKFL